MNTPHTAAIRSAADDIALRLGLAQEDSDVFANVIERRIAPLLEQAEKENQTLRAAFAVADDQSEHCQSLVAGLEQERDTALAKLAACEAAYAWLHSQVGGYLHGESWDHWRQFNEPKAAAHLSKQEPAP